eukprot:g31545.t1
MDAFAGQDATIIKTSDLESCKEFCRRNGWSGFTYWENAAYFRAQDRTALLENQTPTRGCILFVCPERTGPLQRAILNEGMPQMSRPGRRGDLFVLLHVEWPEVISDDLVKILRDADKEKIPAEQVEDNELEEFELCDLDLLESGVAFAALRLPAIRVALTRGSEVWSDSLISLLGVPPTCGRPQLAAMAKGMPRGSVGRLLSNGRPEAQRPAEPQAPPRAKQKGTPRGSVGRLVATEVKEEKAKPDPPSLPRGSVGRLLTASAPPPEPPVPPAPRNKVPRGSVGQLVAPRGPAARAVVEVKQRRTAVRYRHWNEQLHETCKLKITAGLGQMEIHMSDQGLEDKDAGRMVQDMHDWVGWLANQPVLRSARKWTIITLDFSHNSLTAVGVRVLCQFLQNARISCDHWNLAGNPIDDDGFLHVVRHITAAPGREHRCWCSMASAQFTELSLESLKNWAHLSGLSSRELDRSAQQMLESVAQLSPQHFILKQLQRNLLPSARQRSLKLFDTQRFKRTAVVMLGQPPEEVRGEVRKTLRKERQEKAAAEVKRAKRPSKWDNCEKNAASAEDLEAEVLKAMEAVEVTEEEERSFLERMTAAARRDQDIVFAWQGEEGSAEYLKRWIADKKLVERVPDLRPNEWFREKLRQWQQTLSRWKRKQEDWSDPSARRKPKPVGPVRRRGGRVTRRRAKLVVRWSRSNE